MSQRKGNVPVGTPKNATKKNFSNPPVAPPRPGSIVQPVALIALTVLAVVLAVVAISIRSPTSSKSDIVVRRPASAEPLSSQPDRLRWNVTCDKKYEAAKGCAPKQCARVLRDAFVSEREVERLRNLADRIMRHGGGSGGPTIFDLNSGALSKGDKFVDLYTQMKTADRPSPLDEEDRQLLHAVLERVKAAVVAEFQVAPGRLWLTAPTFFSRIQSDAVPVTMNDEYWHEHIDRIAYGSFVYSSLIYLSDYGVDFEGGEFVFVDGLRKHTIEPAKGRFHLFTSGSENVHYVAKVTRGVRYALTVAFTCDKSKGVHDFLSKATF